MSTAMTAAHDTEWSPMKATVAEALDDALAVIDEADKQGRELWMTEYMASMTGRRVTVAAAQDTLRFLKGTGAIFLSTYGTIQTSPEEDI